MEVVKWHDDKDGDDGNLNGIKREDSKSVRSDNTKLSVTYFFNAFFKAMKYRKKIYVNAVSNRFWECESLFLHIDDIMTSIYGESNDIAPASGVYSKCK